MTMTTTPATTFTTTRPITRSTSLSATTTTILTRTVRPLAVAGFAVALLCAPLAHGTAQDLDVPYVPTPQDVVNRMLEMAAAGPSDIHYDLGSGDGRIVITAVRDFNVKKGVGVDLNPIRVSEANENAAAAGVTDRVTFVEGNVFDFDFSEATVVTMYLLPEVNLRLRPAVLDLKPGTRVVSHDFDMESWRPDEMASLGDADIYFWTVPAKVDGTWEGNGHRLDLKQEFQYASGSISTGDDRAEIENARIEGPRMRFEIRSDGRTLRFDGHVSGDTMNATIDGRKVVLKRAG